MHFHHAIFGSIFMCVGGVGGLVVQKTRSGWAAGAAALLGIGMALVLDEFALVLFLKDVYWSEQGRLSVEVVFIAVALCGLALLGWVPLGITPSIRTRNAPGDVPRNCSRPDDQPGPHRHLPAEGKGLVWRYRDLHRPVRLVGAIRVARPGSLWARRRYPEDSRKLAKAIAREKRYGRPLTRLLTWFQDAIAGGPDHNGD